MHASNYSWLLKRYSQWFHTITIVYDLSFWDYWCVLFHAYSSTFSIHFSIIYMHKIYCFQFIHVVHILLGIFYSALVLFHYLIGRPLRTSCFCQPLMTYASSFEISRLHLFNFWFDFRCIPKVWSVKEYILTFLTLLLLNYYGTASINLVSKMFWIINKIIYGNYYLIMTPYV